MLFQIILVDYFYSSYSWYFIDVENTIILAIPSYVVYSYILIQQRENRSFVYQIRVDSYLFRDFYTRRKTRRKTKKTNREASFKEPSQSCRLETDQAVAFDDLRFSIAMHFPLRALLCAGTLCVSFLSISLSLLQTHSIRPSFPPSDLFESFGTNQTVQGTAFRKAKTRIDRLVNDTFPEKRKVKKFEIG